MNVPLRVFWCVMAALVPVGVGAVAGDVDHFGFAAIPVQQRVGVPFAAAVTAFDADGAVATNFSGPVQLYFTNQAAPVYFNDFAGGVSFDTDGDGVSDGAQRGLLGPGAPASVWYEITLETNRFYTFSADFALEPMGSGAVLVGQDGLVIYGFWPAQFAEWGGWFPAGQVSRYTGWSEFKARGEGVHLLELRWWLPLGGSALAYTDNIRVRRRDISPGLVILEQGHWAGTLSALEPGPQQVLRASNNQGRSGDSNPFDVLPPLADLGILMLPHSPLAAGEWVWIQFAITNHGVSTMEGAWVTNEVPADLELWQTYPYGGAKVSSNLVVTPLPPVAGQSALEYILVARRYQAGPAAVTAVLGVPDYDSDPSNHEAGGVVTFVPQLTAEDVVVHEAPGGTNATFVFRLNVPHLVDVGLDYAVQPGNATPGADYLAPATGTIEWAAGSTQQVVIVPVLDDVVVEAEERFQLVWSVRNGGSVMLTRSNAVATIVSDDPMPTVTVELPVEALESAGTLTNGGRFTLSAPFGEDLTLEVLSSDSTEVLSPGSRLLRAGETQGVFDIRVVDDGVWDATQGVTLSVSCTNGLAGSAAMQILNDDPPALALSMVQKPSEGQGTWTNALNIFVPYVLSTNLLVSLESSDATELTVSPEAVLTAGNVSVRASVTVVDDLEADGPQPVRIIARAPGFEPGTLALTVSDNDVHHFAFRSPSTQDGLIPDQTSTVPFSVSILARDVASNVISGFRESVTLSATSDLGWVVLSPTNAGLFQRGAWSGPVTILNGDHTQVRLVAAVTNGGPGAGQSNPFRVFAPEGQQLRLLSVERAGDDVLLRFQSVEGRHYRLEAAGEASGAAWTSVISSLMGQGGPMSASHHGAAAASRGFYRVVLQP